MSHTDETPREELPAINATKAPVNAFLESILGRPFPYGNGSSLKVTAYIGDEVSLLQTLRLEEPQVQNEGADTAVIRDAVRLGNWPPFQGCLLQLHRTIDGLNKISFGSVWDVLRMIEAAATQPDLSSQDKEYVDLLADIVSGWMPRVVDAFADYWLNKVTMPGPVANFLKDKEPELRVYLGRRMRAEEVHEVYKTLGLQYERD